jgi:uncharacterized protein (DUF2235 family)
MVCEMSLHPTRRCQTSSNALNIVPGIHMIILDAYNYLCQNNQKDPGDEIFLIGFSRGAYAARCLADLVDQKGLLLNSERDKLHAINKHWSQNSFKKQPKQRKISERHYPSITACALWDTGSSIGTPIPRGILHCRLASVNSRLQGNFQHVFQALSLHQHRYHFSPILLLPSAEENEPTLQQCWFAGIHADVGGGRKKSASAHFALIWMISKLERWLTSDSNNLYSNDSSPTDTTWKVDDPCGVKRRRGTCKFISLVTNISNHRPNDRRLITSHSLTE